MILTPAQNTIAADLHRFRVLNCGRRFGKTTLAVEEIKGKALGKVSRIAYLAPTYQQARDIAWELLKKELSTITVKVNESRLELTVRTLVGKGESLIVLRGWEAVETLRGQQFDLVIIDEVASMRNFDLAWQEVVRPTLTDTRGEVLFISSPKGFNHFYDLYNKQATDADYASFHFTSYDNPHLPVEELDKAKNELTEDRFAQEYMADFRKTEGLVYKEFDRKIHLYDGEIPTRVVETLAGIDPGFTHPCAVITVKRDADDNYWVDNEYYQPGHTDAENAEYVASQGFNKTYPDPESPGFIKELKTRGVSVRLVVKGKDSIKNGISQVRELFKTGKLKIHSRCRNLILELETYSYPDKQDGHGEAENPIKENDDAVDALRYVLMMQSQFRGNQVRQFRPTGMDRYTTPKVQGALDVPAPREMAKRYQPNNDQRYVGDPAVRS